jgi:hypothetical protein
MPETVGLTTLFSTKYGSHGYDNKSALDPGETPVISSQGVDNGVFGFFDVPKKYQPPVISVPRTGSIGDAFVQHSACNITDDCIVLKPLVEVSIEYLYYIVAMIRNCRWRFNYGRKITPERLKMVKVLPPEKFNSKISYDDAFKQVYPVSNASIKSFEKRNMKKINITTLFDIDKGHFHAIDRLEIGTFPTISRISTDNGIVGFYKKPKKSKLLPSKTLTISTVTGDAFLQINPFIATDNVLVCMPKKDYQITTLIYIQALLNKIKWRYSYGRQPYKRIFEKTTVLELPVKDDETIDEEYIKKIVENTKYYSDLVKRIQN